MEKFLILVGDKGDTLNKYIYIVGGCDKIFERRDENETYKIL